MGDKLNLTLWEIVTDIKRAAKSSSVTNVIEPASVVPKSDVFNPFKPEFTIVIFIHYKPRIAVAILDL